MAIIPNTAPVNGPIAPIDSEDTYPTHFANYGKGGFYTVSSLAERNAIPSDRRTLGMTVIVSSGNVLESAIYSLDSGLTNDDWKETIATNATVSVLASAAPGGFKNKIIGGDFLTNPWQRGEIFTPKSSLPYFGYTSNILNAYTADCFLTHYEEASSDVEKQTFRTTRELLSGGSACLSVECTSSLALGTFSYAAVSTLIEGYNFAGIYTSPMTLSFWVYSSVPGKYSLSFRNWRASNADASWVANYTVDSANTWEKKVIVLGTPASESGGVLWNFDNRIGLFISWWLYAAPNYQTALLGQWIDESPLNAAGNNCGYVSTPGCVNAAVTGSVFKLRDVQLEAGRVASTFERLDVSTITRQCGRYYQKSWNVGIAPLDATQTSLSASALDKTNATRGANMYYPADDGLAQEVQFAEVMRATPTVTAWVGYCDTLGPANNLVNSNYADVVDFYEKGFWYTADAVLDPLPSWYWAYTAWIADSSLPFA